MSAARTPTAPTGGSTPNPGPTAEGAPRSSDIIRDDVALGRAVERAAATRLDVACYHHEPVKAELLRTAVLPAARAAQLAGVHAHVERHWRHGPHVRVCLAGEPAAVAARAETVRATLADHLREHPSTADVPVADLLAASVRNGRAELVPPPYDPIHPDNTVLVEPVDETPLADLLGGPGAVEARHGLLAAALPAIDATATATSARGGSGEARVWAALTAMATHAAAYPLGLAAGYNTFLSHVEEFLFVYDRPGTVRARFEQAWERTGDRVTAHVEALATAATPADQPDPLAAAWRRWVDAAWAIAGPAYRRGEIPLTPNGEYRRRAEQVGHEPTARQWDPDRRTGYSDFHLMLRTFDYVRSVEQHFGPYRFITNVLYRVLVVCDVTSIERYLAAYLLSQAVQRINGQPWREAMAEHLDFLAAKRAERAATEQREPVGSLR